MLPESQNTEYKESWRDEYLKWICGFANAQGGRIYLGVNDAREVTGLDEKEAHKLTEDVPNKVRDVLGIIVDVNLLEESGLWYVEIAVPAYSNPINYKGQYHYRSGSTKQELKGAALNRFLLERTGLKWDEYVVAEAKVEDLSAEAFARFRKEAAKSGRVAEDVLQDTNEVLLSNLHLADEFGQKLQRAALLLFHPDPERTASGAYIKLGFFSAEDDDLVFQDEVHGPLMLQVDRALDLLKTKYTYHAISYEGGHRREKSLYPEDALREVLLNAIAHKDYTSGVPIQVSVYPDRIMVWNAGELPENWGVERLFEKHPSLAPNPSVANGFFRAGDIEAWGRGYRRMARVMSEWKLLPPVVGVDNGLMVTLYCDKTKQMRTMGFDERQMAIVDYILEYGRVTNANVQEMFKVSRVTALRLLSGLSPLVELVGGKGVDSHYVMKRY